MPRRNGFAVTALVLGILGLFILFLLVFPLASSNRLYALIPAAAAAFLPVPFAIVGIKQARARAERGEDMAIFGLSLAILWFFAVLVPLSFA